MDPIMRQLLQEGREIYSIDEDFTLKETVIFLTEHEIGAVFVRNAEDQISGLISERDIIRKLARTDGLIQELHVKYVMTRRENFIIGSVNDCIDHLMAVMQSHKIRHLPIVDSDGHFIGLFSVRDFIRVLLEHTSQENHQLRDFIYGHYHA